MGVERSRQLCEVLGWSWFCLVVEVACPYREGEDRRGVFRDGLGDGLTVRGLGEGEEGRVTSTFLD